MSNWYWNKRLAEMAADFVGFQGTPNAFGNALKSQIEDQSSNLHEWSLAVAGLAQSSAAVTAQAIPNPAYLTRPITGVIPWVGLGG